MQCSVLAGINSGINLSASGRNPGGDSPCLGMPERTREERESPITSPFRYPLGLGRRAAATTELVEQVRERIERRAAEIVCVGAPDGFDRVGADQDDFVSILLRETSLVVCIQLSGLTRSEFAISNLAI